MLAGTQWNYIAAWTKNPANSKNRTRSLQSLLLGLGASSAHVDWIGMIDSQRRMTMLKQLSICAALLLLGNAGVKAQQSQQEAVLQKLEVRGAAFDIVLAMPKSPAQANLDLRGQPDPLMVYLAGGELVMAVHSELQGTFKDLGALQSPLAIFHVERNGSKSSVAVYPIPKGEDIRETIAQTEPQADGSTKIEVPGADFGLIVSQHTGWHNGQQLRPD
jgi:hypothetical protein